MSAGRIISGLLLAMLFWHPAAADRRVALVIGNGDYVHVPRLDNPANDARLIAGTLKQIGFTLIGGGAQMNLDRFSMERAIREFGRAIGPGTVALFYYSGHGLQIRGNNYLVPVQADLASASDVDFELLDVDVVVRQMDAAHSSLNLIILDACRNNPFGGRGLRDGSGGLAEMRAPRGTLISYATQPGGVAKDGNPGGDSPYSIALSKALQVPGIDVFKAFNLVGLQVSESTSGSQVPWLASSPIEGEFFLAAAPAAAPPPPPLAPPPPEAAAPPAYSTDRDALFWHSIEGTNRRDELEAYLKKFPDGTFADLARSRLALLQTPRTAPLPAPVVAPPAPTPPPRPRIVQRPPPEPPAPARPRAATAAPEPAPSSGFAATAVDGQGRRFRANAASEGAAVGSALQQCHASAAGECRIVSLAGSSR